MKPYRPLALTAPLLLGAALAAEPNAALELMVKKGLVTRAEADAALAQAAPPPVPPPAPPAPGEPGPVTLRTAAHSFAERITFSGGFQGRYTGIMQHERRAGAPEPASTNGFTARRVFLNFDIRLRNGWQLVLTPAMDGAPNPASGNTSSFYLDDADLRHTTAYGTLAFGLRKVNFGCEENESAMRAYAVERSMASQHLATNNLASRHFGVFWNGVIKDTGVFYGTAITNAAVNSPAPTAANNEFATWANLGYRTGAADAGGQTTLGLNGGYIGEMASVSTFARADSAAGLNPYATYLDGRFFARAELLIWHLAQPDPAHDEDLLGLNLTAAYRVTPVLEPVLRCSLLNAGATGITNNGAILGAQPNRTTYGDARSVYAGLNWYVHDHSFKVQTGYEFTRLTDSAPTDSALDAHALRVQVQVTF